MTANRHLAHVSSYLRQPIVFLTVCTAGRRALLAHKTAHDILADIWRESLSRQGWQVGRYVIMPDHVHLFARGAREGVALARWTQTWKSLSARRITSGLGVPAPIWQPDYFDRFLRTADSYSSKWDYVRENPVRAGLVPRAEDWPHRGDLGDLKF